MKIQKFAPTPFQEAFFSAIEQQTSNILLKAVAGSGKTTTIIQSLAKIPHLYATDVLLVAFSTHIRAELSRRQHLGDIPFEVNISTLHALGYQAISSYNKNVSGHGKLNVDAQGSELTKQIQDYSFTNRWFGASSPHEVSKPEWRYISEYCLLLAKLIKQAKLTLSLDVQTLTKAVEKLDDHRIQDEHIERAIELLSVLYISTKPYYIHTVSYEDMIFLPVIYGLPLDQYDVIYIDECQDLNKSMFQFVKKLRKERGRIIAVGDPQQAIYGFAGADSESYSNFLKLFPSIELPLSESFRCPKAVVSFVNAVCNPSIRAFETNKEGEVRYGSYLEAADQDLILCRTNDPLVSLCLDYLARGKKATIKGKDFGQSLIRLLQEIGSPGEDKLIQKLDSRLKALQTKLIEKYGQDYVIEKDRRYMQLAERVACLQVLFTHNRSLKELIDYIESIFSESGGGIILSTIHKAKGLEAERVFILFDAMTPSNLAQTKEELEQENNLLYVAYTRSKHSLIFINDFSRAGQPKEEVATHSRRLDKYLAELLEAKKSRDA